MDNKLLTERARRIEERNAAIRREYASLMATGSMTTAVVRELGRKYGLSAPTVYIIIRASR